MLRFKRIDFCNMYLLKNMTLRQADIDEITVASGGKNVWDAMKSAVMHSNEWTEVCFEDETDEILMVFGLSSVDGVGVPWMVASPNVTKYTKILMRYAKKVIKGMNEQFPLLINYVDSRNVDHIRWLQHMGFKFSGVEHMIDRIPFKQFHMERK